MNSSLRDGAEVILKKGMSDEVVVNGTRKKTKETGMEVCLLLR